MTLALDQSMLTIVIALITAVGSVGTVIVFTILHFRVLRILRALIARLPLALANEIIRDATSSEEKPLISMRGSKRVSCHFFVRKEQFNEKLGAALDRYQQASTFPLKSRVSLAAVGLWFLIVVLLGMYFMGSGAVSQSNPSSTSVVTNQLSSLNRGNVQTNAQGSRTVAGDTTATPAAQANRNEVAVGLRNASLGIVALGGGVALLAVCLVFCYHYGVFGILVEDVVTLCETVGLVTVKSTPTGTSVIDKVVPAKDDPDFKALLRLIKNKKG